jgi:hypothetical protein
MEQLRICFDPPPEWVYWWPGLDPSGVTELAAQGWVKDTGGLAATITEVDRLAQDDGTVALCALWAPRSNQGLPIATLLVHTYGRTEPVDQAYARFVEASVSPPPLPGCWISSYDWVEAEVDVGRVVVQEIRFSDASTQLVSMVRYTVFPEVKNEIAVFDFEALGLDYAEALNEASIEVMNNAFYVQEMT